MRPITRTVVFSGCSLLFAFCAIVGGSLLLRVVLPADSGFDPDPLATPIIEAPGRLPDEPQGGELGAQDPVMEEVGAMFEETKGELRIAYDESKDALPPELAQSLAEDFSMIEGAIAEIGAALASEPDNESLKRMLVATYRNQMLLLKRALHLVADEAGEGEGGDE